jgi:hypothetical protein
MPGTRKESWPKGPGFGLPLKGVVLLKAVQDHLTTPTTSRSTWDDRRSFRDQQHHDLHRKLRASELHFTQNKMWNVRNSCHPITIINMPMA